MAIDLRPTEWNRQVLAGDLKGPLAPLLARLRGPLGTEAEEPTNLPRPDGGHGSSGIATAFDGGGIPPRIGVRGALSEGLLAQHARREMGISEPAANVESRAPARRPRPRINAAHKAPAVERAPVERAPVEDLASATPRFSMARLPGLENVARGGSAAPGPSTLAGVSALLDAARAAPDMEAARTPPRPDVISTPLATAARPLAWAETNAVHTVLKGASPGITELVDRAAVPATVDAATEGLSGVVGSVLKAL